MDIQTLQNHVLTLATLEESDEPVVSCYLNLEHGLAPARQSLEARAHLLRRSLPKAHHAAFEQALQRIETRLGAEFLPESLGAAVFSRSGEEPFFLDLEFRVPLPNWIAVSSTPNIYHLVELKDTYDRYVVVLVDDKKTRILEVHLGSITESALTRRPDLRERVGSGWSREHYQSHRRERNNQIANEEVKFVDEVMSAGRYAHLILAGTPTLTAALRQALPKRLLSKLIDIVPATANDTTSHVVQATLASFIDEEQMESLAAVERLRQAICSHGLAVAGSKDCLLAMKSHQVDLLVMAAEYVPEPAWICADCEIAHVQDSCPVVCPDCGGTRTRILDVKEELARLAQLAGCAVEIVHDSDTLMTLGGVGCLLRFLMPAGVQAQRPAAVC